ncbi:MAG TPA: SCO family protein [Terracidiphilus sp.]|jgi:protein SCO1/2|nr:SCO family protein [Terracidiphilus sp.]
MALKLLASACILLVALGGAAEEHSAQGILLEVNPGKHLIVVSCEAIPGYMDAMVMPFTVRGSEDLKALVPGMTLQFKISEGKNEAYAEHLQVVKVSNFESEPTEAGRLTFLHRTLDPTAEAKIVQVGQPVPDFVLTDQAQETTRLSQFKGKVVALTFAYSRCPNPNYCFRLSNNLSILERRFHARMESDLILMTIVIDPDQDRGKALQRYADTWKANPAAWRFLTGTLPDVREVAETFGMDFWSDEGFLTHSFHTVVIDRDGNLAANLEGNQFTAGQLGDLVETVLHRPASMSPASALK